MLTSNKKTKMTETRSPIAPEATSSDVLIEERNAWLDATLNPEGFLPTIMLEDSFVPRNVLSDSRVKYNRESRPESHRMPASDDQGNNIGYIEISIPTGSKSEEEGACATVVAVETDSAHRGVGYGKALYLATLKHLPAHLGLKSDGRLTKGSFSVWKWLEESGVAEHQGAPDSLIPDETGHYIRTRFRTKF